MMGRLWVALLVLAGILTAALSTSQWLDGLTEDIIVQLEQAEELALAEDWSGATTATQDALQLWTDSQFPLHALMRHAETDDIQISFHQVLEYLEQEDIDLYAAMNGQLVTQLELLAEMERPSLENVL